MAGGWLIGVLVQIAGEPKPLRHYYAVGHEDQAKSEWTAVDWAGRAGRVATSPLRPDRLHRLLAVQGAGGGDPAVEPPQDEDPGPGARGGPRTGVATSEALADGLGQRLNHPLQFHSSFPALCREPMNSVVIQRPRRRPWRACNACDHGFPGQARE